MLGCVRAWLVDSIVRVANSLSFSLFLLLFFSVLVGVWRLDGGALGGGAGCASVFVYSATKDALRLHRWIAPWDTLRTLPLALANRHRRDISWTS